MRIKPTLAAILLLLTGCTVGPNFERPETWSPGNWFTESVTQAPVPSVPVAGPIDPRWWSAFNDPELTALEARVAGANLDIQATSLRFAESRAQRRITAVDEYPQVNGDAMYARELPSAKGVISLLGGSGGGNSSVAGSANGIPSGPIGAFNLYQYGFDASWELDLWGRVRRSVEAADANLLAANEARRDMLVSVLAEVARDYIQLRGIQTQLKISHENLDIAQDNLKLTSQRAAAGLSAQLDVANAAAQLSSATAAIPQLEQQQTQTINQLGFLLGEPPGALSAELITPQAVPPVPPQVPVGLPSELARRRPDILQAEAQLRAQTAQIGVAEANFYPAVNLIGNFDIQALQFSDLGNWAARTYSIGPSITLPIFEGGRLRGNLELSKATQQEAAINYRRTVLNAWTEVSNALFAYQAEQKRRDQLDEAVTQTRHALDLARQQYTQGLTNFLDVLTAQQRLLTAQQQQADSTTTVSTNLVALYKALGGGWETAFPQQQQPL